MKQLFWITATCSIPVKEATITETKKLKDGIIFPPELIEATDSTNANNIAVLKLPMEYQDRLDWVTIRISPF